MILINLLPHREAARKRRRDIFHILLASSALVGGVISGAIFLWFQAAISVQQGTNTILEAEIKKLESQIKDIAGLESEIRALRARQQAVEDLQADRNLPVHLLTEIVNQLPDGVFVAKLNQTDQLVTINGVAQSNDRVSELLRNFANNTPWFAKPELLEIVSGTINLSTREQKRVYNFVVRVKLVRSSEVEKSAPVSTTPASVPQMPASVASKV